MSKNAIKIYKQNERYRFTPYYIYKEKANVFLFHFAYILIAVLLHGNSYPFAMQFQCFCNLKSMLLY